MRNVPKYGLIVDCKIPKKNDVQGDEKCATVPLTDQTTMYITKEELEKRLNKTELQIVKKERKVREKEDRLTNEERILIGTLTELDSNKNVAELMGVSAQTVSNVSRGMIAPESGINKELKEGVEKGKEEISKQRLETEKKIQEQLITNLAAALGHVSNNIHNTDAKEASKIAVDMSSILNRVTGASQDNKGHKTAIIINVPNMKEERHYETIDV